MGVNWSVEILCLFKGLVEPLARGLLMTTAPPFEADAADAVPDSEWRFVEILSECRSEDASASTGTSVWGPVRAPGPSCLTAHGHVVSLPAHAVRAWGSRVAQARDRRARKTADFSLSLSLSKKRLSLSLFSLE